MNGMHKWTQRIDCLLAGKKCALAAQELAAQMEKFEGLYEPTYLFAQKGQNLPSPLREWTTRAQRISPDGPLARYLEALGETPQRKNAPQKQGKGILRLIRVAGICREKYDGQALTISGRQLRAYIALDGHEIREGETVQILKAAWYLEERVAEHGLAGELS